MGLAWEYLWLRLSLGPGVTWKVDIKERIQRVWTKMPCQGVSSDSAICFVLFATRMWKRKTTSCWSWFKDSRVLDFILLANGESLKASPVKCCPWLGRKSPLWWCACCFLHCFPLLHLSSVYQTRFTKCAKVSNTTVLLRVLFFLLSMSPPLHLLGLCLFPNHLFLSRFLHLRAWGRCPCHGHLFFSVKASDIPIIVVEVIVCVTRGL